MQSTPTGELKVFETDKREGLCINTQPLIQYGMLWVNITR